MTPLLPQTSGDSVNVLERAIKGLFPGNIWVPGEKFQKYAYTHTYIRIRKFHYYLCLIVSLRCGYVCDFIHIGWTYQVSMNNFFIAAHIQMKNKKEKFSRRFRRGWLLPYFSSRFSLLRCPRQRRLHERYS